MRFLVLSTLPACAASSAMPAEPAPVHVGVRTTGDALVAVGMVEVPMSARRQIAEAGAAAHARAELLRYVETRIAVLERDTISSDGATTASQHIVELVRGAMTGFNPPTHVHTTFMREGMPMLRVVAELVIPRDDLARVLPHPDHAALRTLFGVTP